MLSKALKNMHFPKVKSCGEMSLLWFLFLNCLLVTSSLAQYQDELPLHLTLYHARHGPHSLLTSQSPVSLFEIFDQDEARVKALNIRILKNNISTSTIPASASASAAHKSSLEHLIGPKSISLPLNPGISIGVGNYYVKVGLGTPPKYYPMVVDTGSSFSWLQCQPCKVYCHTQVGTVFDPSASKTYKSLSCATSECSSLEDATLNKPLCTSSNVCVYTASYGDSSYSMGYLSRESLSLQTTTTLPGFVYGCGQDNEGLFGRAAGLIGLARHKLSMLAQLSAKYGYAFSYCLPTTTGGGGVGSLSIGTTAVMTSTYKFTPMLTDSRDPSLYFLRLTAIKVGGRVLTGLSAIQYRVPTIIDSGTVITRLPPSVYTAFRQEFVKIMTSSKYQIAPAFSILDTCFKGSLKDMSAVPKVGLVFQGGVDLTLGPQNVLIDVDEEGTTCLAFTTTNGVAIIGNRQQQTIKVGYDITNSRIGFAVGGCH